MDWLDLGGIPPIFYAKCWALHQLNHWLKASSYAIYTIICTVGIYEYERAVKRNCREQTHLDRI